MTQLLAVGIGGAAGSVLRFLCQRLLNGPAFPYGTFAVNLTGCLLIGIFWGLFLKQQGTETLRVLLMAGFCGGFTTFSAFTLEGIRLLTDQRWATFFIYVLFSVAAGLLATFAGYKLTT